MLSGLAILSIGILILPIAVLALLTTMIFTRRLDGRWAVAYGLVLALAAIVVVFGGGYAGSQIKRDDCGVDSPRTCKETATDWLLLGIPLGGAALGASALLGFRAVNARPTGS